MLRLPQHHRGINGLFHVTLGVQVDFLVLGEVAELVGDVFEIADLAEQRINELDQARGDRRWCG